jgi:AmmeMemoRadiSam system protein B/AmmeMemoRadiSam system protein A
MDTFFPIIILLIMMVVPNCGSSQRENPKRTEFSPEEIRRSAVAGQFYPGSAKKLNELVQVFFNNVKSDPKIPNIMALVSPHAGLVYSGQTAAHAYKQVFGNEYDAVVIIAPSHHDVFPGASIWAKGAYETPLGLIPVNEEIAAELMTLEPAIQSRRAGHDREHSLEVQLPFLQAAVKNLSIVPIVVQDYSLENCQRIAGALARVGKDKRVLLVASTDLYHGESYENCVEICDYTLEQIQALQPEKLHKSFNSHQSQACGAGPVVIVELAAKALGANKATILHQTNSNDVIGERGGYVVGYGAIAIYSEESGAAEKIKSGIDLGLSLEEKRQLMEIAKKSIDAAVRGQKIPTFKVDAPVLLEKRGAFVTLNKHNRLRGCIGYITAFKSLYLTVSEMAQAAALRDPRFPAVKPAELKDLEIDISVLTPIRECTNVEEIEVGKHGIIIERGHSSGLLLPQVATEQNWDRVTFLEHTCTKAGLPRNAWQEPGTVIKIFSADVFTEADLK